MSDPNGMLSDVAIETPSDQGHSTSGGVAPQDGQHGNVGHGQDGVVGIGQRVGAVQTGGVTTFGVPNRLGVDRVEQGAVSGRMVEARQRGMGGSEGMDTQSAATGLTSSRMDEVYRLTYNHKAALWRLSRAGLVVLDSPGFNDRATFISLGRHGLVQIEEGVASSGKRLERATLTDAGQRWVRQNPDRILSRRGH